MSGSLRGPRRLEDSVIAARDNLLQAVIDSNCYCQTETDCMQLAETTVKTPKTANG